QLQALAATVPTPRSRLRIGTGSEPAPKSTDGLAAGAPELTLQHRVQRVVDPVAPDQQLLAQDSLPGEAQLLGDPLRADVADGDPQGELVEPEHVEARRHERLGGLGGVALAIHVRSDPVTDLADSAC